MTKVKVLKGKLVALFALSLAGCISVGPDFEKPETQVLESWKAHHGPSASINEVQSPKWWKTFNDPVLDDLIERAYRQNLTLQIAGLRVFEARALLGIAVGSLYPQGQNLGGSTGSVEVSLNADPIATLPEGLRDVVETDFDRNAIGLDMAWEMDFWGRYRRGVESTDALFEARIAGYDDYLVTLIGDVGYAYVLLRTLEERLVFAQENVKRQERSLEIASVRFRNGLVTELDVQLAKTLLNNTRSIIPLYVSGIHNTRLALALLMGMPPGDLQEIIGGAGTVPEATTDIAVGIPADLLRRRPDIRRAELLAAAQSARIGIATADLYPSFRLIGSVGFAAKSGGDVFESDSDYNFGVFDFNWKILNYGRLRNRIRMEDARYQQAVLGYENTVLNAAREVESSLMNFAQAKERVNALQESVSAARRAVDLSQAQYRDGVISYTLVLDAQQFLLLNEDLLTVAKGSVANSLIATNKALGGGWQIRAGQPLLPQEIKADMKERVNWGKLLETEAPMKASEEERDTWRAPDL